MKNILFRIIFTILPLLCFSCENETVDIKEGNEIEIDTPVTYRLLFIGNSLTYANGLPELVKSYAASQGKDISVSTIAHGNYALVDHWADGIMQEQIESGKFDFVIVQQGPSSQPYGRGLLIEYGNKISALCYENSAKLAFYMVWPSRQYYNTFDGVIESYRMAANENSDLLCPVGEVWQTYFNETDDFSYYGADGFHPSLKGSEVAAEVIYKSLFE